MKSIVVFNNKGGVGKTTLLCNIAAFLKIKMNKRILVVDADPQCNTTTYMFPFTEIEKIYSSSQKDHTINKIVKNLDKYKTDYDVFSLIKSSSNFEVDIIPGDTKLSLSEDFLSKDWPDVITGNHRGIQTNLLFKDLLYKLDDHYDFVFFDVGPSLGALNRSVLLASDYFIVPMSSDIFSIQALENISISLNKWKDEISEGLNRYRKNNDDENFRLNGTEISWQLKFAGYVTQQYTAKTVDGKKRAVKAYENIIKKIPDAIQQYLLPLNGVDIPSPQLGEITNLSSLIPLSQNSNVPIFNLKSEHGVVGAHFSKVKEYECTVSDMVERLMNNLDTMP